MHLRILYEFFTIFLSLSSPKNPNSKLKSARVSKCITQPIDTLGRKTPLSRRLKYSTHTNIIKI